MHLPPKTVDTDRSRLMGNLGLDNVPDLVRSALREGLIEPGDPGRPTRSGPHPDIRLTNLLATEELGSRHALGHVAA